jgi:hypothetical protein
MEVQLNNPRWDFDIWWGIVEIIGPAHREFPIIPNKSQTLIHTWWVGTL